MPPPGWACVRWAGVGKSRGKFSTPAIHDLASAGTGHSAVHGVQLESTSTGPGLQRLLKQRKTVRARFEVSARTLAFISRLGPHDGLPPPKGKWNSRIRLSVGYCLIVTKPAGRPLDRLRPDFRLQFVEISSSPGKRGGRKEGEAKSVRAECRGTSGRYSRRIRLSRWARAESSRRVRR